MVRVRVRVRVRVLCLCLALLFTSGNLLSFGSVKISGVSLLKLCTLGESAKFACDSECRISNIRACQRCITEH